MPLNLTLAGCELRDSFKKNLKEKGIAQLYPWQAAALREVKPAGSNFVYVAPTSGVHASDLAAACPCRAHVTVMASSMMTPCSSPSKCWHGRMSISQMFLMRNWQPNAPHELAFSTQLTCRRQVIGCRHLDAAANATAHQRLAQAASKELGACPVPEHRCAIAVMIGRSRHLVDTSHGVSCCLQRDCALATQLSGASTGSASCCPQVLPSGLHAVAERGIYLKELCRGSRLRVQAYSSPDAGCPLSAPQENIAICSYEKGNSAVNRLIASGKLTELCCVIVDEFHMLADTGRGPALEVLLTKLRAFAPATQLVCISATMGNLQPVVAWLNANLFLTNFRPVRLTEHMCIGPAVFNVQPLMQKSRAAHIAPQACAAAGGGKLSASNNADAALCSSCRQLLAPAAVGPQTGSTDAPGNFRPAAIVDSGRRAGVRGKLEDLACPAGVIEGRLCEQGLHYSHIMSDEQLVAGRSMAEKVALGLAMEVMHVCALFLALPVGNQTQASLH